MIRRLENIVKKNSYMNKLYTLVGSFIVNVLGLFINEDPKTILFVSYMGKNFNDSPKMIYDKLIEDSYFRDYTFIWAFNDLDKYDLENKNTEIVKMNSFKYLLTALRSSYWITNVNIEKGLHFKKKYTKSINTWHGVPLKKIGNDVEGRNDFDFSNTNLFCYSSDYEFEIYKKAFKLTDKNLYKIGMPRNDLVLKNNLVTEQEIRNKYKVKNKKIILYAPTWREDSEDLKLMNLNQWARKLSKDYILLIKAHGLTERFNVKENKFIIDVSDYEETSELIVAADILITDYSSIMFDFALLDKPIFIYATDYEKYSRERGFYFDLDETVLNIFENDKELLDYIQNYDDNKERKKTRKFNENFIEVRSGNATDKILELMKEDKL